MNSVSPKNLFYFSRFRSPPPPSSLSYTLEIRSRHDDPRNYPTLYTRVFRVKKNGKVIGVLGRTRIIRRGRLGAFIMCVFNFVETQGEGEEEEERGRESYSSAPRQFAWMNRSNSARILFGNWISRSGFNRATWWRCVQCGSRLLPMSRSLYRSNSQNWIVHFHASTFTFTARLPPLLINNI